MVGNYIVLSKQQTDWMRRVVKNMLELTAYYSFARQPLREMDYENIAGAFSNYTKKSHNNAIIIESGAAFMEYLDELARGKQTEVMLDRRQMQELEEVTDKLFDMAAQNQGKALTENQQEEFVRKIDLCGQSLGKHRLLVDMKKIFKEYFAFCVRDHTALQQEENVRAPEPAAKQRYAKSR